ncbi:MAG: YraN family protein [Candidatus Zixiibacteriota bacterium]|nr:MAG: YraN family protein [candidate division Zixibacteria bacterium]
MSTPSSKPGRNRKSRQLQGRAFENLAGQFYTDQGFEILERNWRAGRKEIDLIVRKNTLIVFVEVKSAYSRKFGHPAEKVDERKIQNLSEVAQQYLITKNIKGTDLRFDVVTFIDGKLEHFPDAFSI